MTRLGKPLFLPDIIGREMTAEIADKLWAYSPSTGLFLWKVSPRNHINAGDVAGVIGFHGYRILCFRRKKHKAARIAWLLMTGKWPDGEIDHLDRDRANDKWDNLREATSGQNKCNIGVRSDNALGIKGVVKNKHGTYTAYICFAGKRKNLGSFKTPEEAKACYDAAAAEWHREFMCTGQPEEAAA